MRYEFHARHYLQFFSKVGLTRHGAERSKFRRSEFEPSNRGCGWRWETFPALHVRVILGTRPLNCPRASDRRISYFEFGSFSNYFDFVKINPAVFRRLCQLCCVLTIQQNIF